MSEEKVGKANLEKEARESVSGIIDDMDKSLRDRLGKVVELAIKASTEKVNEFLNKQKETLKNQVEGKKDE